ncbi:MAG: DegT/DnrJ/EryC1/StrS family aminotransferase [Acidobacteria bacterium]|nr:DegT/DnrJ/EryC1/StrS family aminotransferase [Acidobacteriota bacterium]MXZ38359.1 DegT/DnrJ/EryC1/StrS family aminotransferase [Holophagales bacterium]
MAGRGSSTKLALLGGTPVRAEAWPQWPARGAEEERALVAALRDGDWGGFPLPNERSAAFAAAFAERHDCGHALCVANGTVSLEAALQAMGVEPGAEVIVPAYTFEATASAALFSGCVPVFADIDPETWCIDIEAAAALVTERTQAIVPVHLAMTIADLDAIGKLAEKQGLAVLEDCAHAHGARWRGRGVGSWGDAGSFSFQTSKLMTAGEGGIVTTSDDALLDRLHALVNCGRQRPGAAEPTHVIGHNYRMTDLQAAILEVQLGRLDEQHLVRRRNASRLRAAIEDIDGLTNLRIDDRVTTQAIYQFVFRFDGKAFAGIDRDVFVAALQAEGVTADGRFYESLPVSGLLRPDSARYPAWSAALAGAPPADCPNAESAAYRESVWLPHQLLLGTETDVDDIVEAVLKVQRSADDLAGLESAEVERLRQARSAR